MSGKKLTSILSTVVALALTLGTILLTSSHVKKAESMHEQMAAGVSEMSVMLRELVEAKEQGGTSRMLSYARQNKPRATEAANKLRKACDYFQKVHVPSSLKDELKAVKAGIPEMRSFADSFEAMFGGVMTESEFESAAVEMGRYAERLAASDGFAVAEAKFMAELHRLNSNGGFIWL